MKKLLLIITYLAAQFGVSAQVTTITSEQKIAKFNETAKQKAALYASYKPSVASYDISDGFKETHKYLYAWIQDDMMRIATDALFYLCHAKILEVGTNKELASIDHQYDNGGVFSDKFLLSELRAKMPGGTTGYYQIYYATKSNFSGRITFDKSFTVKSPNAAPVEKGPRLNAIQVKFSTMDHDKEAGKWVAIKITKKPKTFADYYNYLVGYLLIEDPAKWDYGNVQNFTINTTANKTYLSDFANGGNVTINNMPTDLWDVTVIIKMEFADGTARYFRKRKTSNPEYGLVMSFDFDKDFKIVKEYDK